MPDLNDDNIMLPYGCFAIGRSLAILHYFRSKFIRHELGHLNMTYDKMSLIIILYYHARPMPLKEINVFFCYSEETLYDLIASLVDDGYITIIEEGENDLERIIEITEKGENLKSEIAKALEKEEKIFSRVVGEEDDTAIRIELYNLADALGFYDFNNEKEL